MKNNVSSLLPKNCTERSEVEAKVEALKEVKVAVEITAERVSNKA